MSFSISFGRIKQTEFSPFFVNDLINEHNKVRKDPKSYIPIVKSFSDVFPIADINEAVSYLNSIIPCNTTLNAVPLMSQIESEWVTLQDSSNTTGHGDLLARIKPYATYRGIAENLSYGFSDPVDILAALIIDSGVPSRGHRKNIFNCTYNQIGVAQGPHKQFKSSVAILYATEFTPLKKTGYYKSYNRQ